MSSCSREWCDRIVLRSAANCSRSPSLVDEPFSVQLRSDIGPSRRNKAERHFGLLGIFKLSRTPVVRLLCT